MAIFKYKLKEGKNPKTGSAMFYGQAAETEVVKASDFCEDIAHATTVTEADVKAVLAETERAIIKHLQNNESVRFGTLGSFCPRLKSNSARLPEEFTTANIKGLSCRFTASSKLRYALDAKNPEVKFQDVTILYEEKP